MCVIASNEVTVSGNCSTVTVQYMRLLGTATVEPFKNFSSPRPTSTPSIMYVNGNCLDLVCVKALYNIVQVCVICCNADYQ